MATRCTACSTVIPHPARFCPKCGAAAPAEAGKVFARDAVPATGPLPRAGKILLGAGLIALALLITGFVTRNPPLIYAGAAVVGVLALTLTVGDIFS
jgi:hypothetical protein